MKRLSGTDSLFLSMEQPNWHQHVGGLTILDRSDAPDFDFLKMREILTTRLPLAPKFTWKLHEVPLGLDRPIWVDDEEFDIDRHLHHVAVPAPGGMEELALLTGRVLSRQLDRRHPLWETWFIEGLPNDRVALLMKYHHCLLDGVAGASLASALLDFAPDAEPPAIPSEDEVERAGPPPSDAALLTGAVGNVAMAPLRSLAYAGRTARRGVTLVQEAREGRAIVPLSVPKTLLNGSVGPRRRLGMCSLAMQDVKALKTHYGVKINDVVLAVVAGALRSYLIDRGELPDRPLVSGVPLSTRAEGDQTADNQVAIMVVSLATTVEDPGERLMTIHASSQGAKEMMRAVRATEIPSMGEVAPPAVLNTTITALARTGVVSRGPTIMNTLVSNVPGPPFPLYTGGARITGIYSTSVITESMGLNITLFSYMDRVDIGLHVDPDVVPDVWTIAGRFPGALGELMASAGLGEPTPVEDPLGGAGAVADTRAGAADIT
ncbi:MAG: wax ester/triacylglycerol synthase family O-acyltransferase [Acidimicrobiales bacterium]|jgi:WS/DGAT/MGAT family acyltransferase|nr:wax ester/triacylglycerol synthase family O-acyltransferase [Acidimicrobiales bacterium]